MQFNACVRVRVRVSRGSEWLKGENHAAGVSDTEEGRVDAALTQ